MRFKSDDGSATDDERTRQELLSYTPDDLHGLVSSRAEAAMGRPLPQMEIRYKNLSVSSDILVSNNKSELVLPTLPNVVVGSMSCLSTNKHLETNEILKNVSGVFKPGTMTLVLGQPGSGKSALMKMLSKRFSMTKTTKIQGEILYNGASQPAVAKRVPQFVSYVTQRDYHHPTLTVRETLEFAHECCGGELSEDAAEALFTKGTPEENREALDAARSWMKNYPDIIIQQLGLGICQNTVVGNASVRGVSGGERKRVTTGEMQFGNKAVTFMDEISTGLDSAAAFDIVKTQLSLARKLRKTIIISLLQPSPEIYELFDNVVILNEGHVIYHGPRELALDHFQELGFVRPPGRDIADYLLDIGTPEQHQYEKGLPPGSSYPRRGSELAAAFERSSIFGEMMEYLKAPVDGQLLLDGEEFFNNILEFRQSFLESTATVIRQQLKITARNVPFLASRVVMITVMGLLMGTVFWNIDAKQVQVVIGVLFQTVLMIALGQFSQLPMFISSRDIFYKQRGANFYRTSSYVLAFSICQMPLALAETLTLGSMVYWMCGFVSSFGKFLIFELLLFLTVIAFTALFFAITCASPNLNIAQPIVMIITGFIILYGGFVISESQMPDALSWIYWINPVTWCLRGLAINQYRSDEFDVPVYKGTDYFSVYKSNMGIASLKVVGLQTGKHWLPLAFVFLGSVYLFCLVLAYIALEYLRYEVPESLGVPSHDDSKPAKASSPVTDTASDYALAESPREAWNQEVVVDVKPSGAQKPSTPVVLAFTDLWYTVPDPKNPAEGLDLLKGVSGYALPGTITALMGSSGAGKTTLMDVIAGRKTGGTIRGKILLNGHEATPLAIQRSTGYCEQMDIHCESATFREALTFSAFLRQPEEVPSSAKYDWVEQCLDLLDMHPIADKIIRGSSVEQMKRLTIGVELAAQPSVLFLDEPTSGLDARSAKIIMESVRKVADTGRTVVCTIHQPSTEVFQVFDNLLLLKRGGYTVYFGELGKNACDLVSYLESIDGVKPLLEGYNPATWMLESIGAGVGNSAGQDTDFVEIFNNSAKKASMNEMLARGGVGLPAPGVPALSFATKRAASNATQARFLIQRFSNMYWRTASYNLTRIGVFTFIGLLFGTSFANVDYTTYQGINGGIGMIFMTTFFIGMISFTGVIPMFGEDRGPFYRERSTQTYNALWYFVGGSLIEIPYVFGATFLTTIIVFPMVGFEGVPEFLFYWLHTAFFVLLLTYLGMFLLFVSPSVEVGTVIGVLWNGVSSTFVGFNPPASQIPKGYKWVYHITPHKYVLEALSTIVLGNCKSDHPNRDACAKLKNTPPTVPRDLQVAQYLLTYYKMDYDHAWRNFFIILGITVAVSAMGLAALRYVNHQKR